MSVKSGNEVRVERVLNSAPRDVFRALSEGRLFRNCGADGERLEIDFREGGGYKSFFANAGVVCCGKFLEIVADRKLVFTWGDVGSDEGFPKTRVLIELSPESGGAKTKILIVHTGFATQEEADAHDHGWCAGLDDLTGELAEGRVRIVRMFPVSRDVLYSACSNPKNFFGIISDVEKGSADFRVGGQYQFPNEHGGVAGEFQEIIPGKKIVFSWLSGCNMKFDRPTRVTLVFDDEDEGGSSLELVHEFLPLGEQVTSHRDGWEYVTAQLQTRFK
ncbi:MAG: SRPBCC domain-containing protein [Bdellovibrionia bacterium]